MLIPLLVAKGSTVKIAGVVALRILAGAAPDATMILDRGQTFALVGCNLYRAQAGARFDQVQLNAGAAADLVIEYVTDEADPLDDPARPAAPVAPLAFDAQGSLLTSGRGGFVQLLSVPVTSAGDVANGDHNVGAAPIEVSAFRQVSVIMALRGSGLVGGTSPKAVLKCSFLLPDGSAYLQLYTAGNGVGSQYTAFGDGLPSVSNGTTTYITQPTRIQSIWPLYTISGGPTSAPAGSQVTVLGFY